MSSDPVMRLIQQRGAELLADAEKVKKRADVGEVSPGVLDYIADEFGSLGAIAHALVLRDELAAIERRLPRWRRMLD